MNAFDGPANGPGGGGQISDEQLMSAVCEGYVGIKRNAHRMHGHRVHVMFFLCMTRTARLN